MKKELQTTKDYKEFVNSLVKEISQARHKAFQTINRQLVDLYLSVGKGIYEKIELSKWSAGIVESLSTDLRRSFPDMKGFSVQNLWRMKELYETYKHHEKLSPLVRELTRTLLILTQRRREYFL